MSDGVFEYKISVRYEFSVMMSELKVNKEEYKIEV
jgi:hypothetical protein